MKKIYLPIIISLACLSNAYTQLNNNGASIKSTTGTYIVLQDISFINKGNFIQTAGIVKMTGGINTTISGTVKPQFFSLAINKNLNKEVQLLTDINISGDISFTSGLINLNTKNIFLSPAATLKGESESTRIVGSTGGYVEVTNLLNAPLYANPGNLGAIVSSTQNLGNTIIRRGHQSQIMGGGNNNSVLRYYDIIPTTNAALNATLRLQYFDAELNGLTENNLVLFKKVNNINWVNQSYSLRSAATNYVIKVGIPDFYRWTISTTNNLPRSANPQAGNAETNIYTNGGLTKAINNVFIETLYPSVGTMQNIYIKAGNMNLQKMQVLMYDMQGKLILHQQINYQSQWLPLPSLLAGGRYTLILQSGEWKYQQSFIKQ